jgi:hypothetical protein
VSRAARSLAVLVSAVLGIAGGVVAGVTLGHDNYPDPLGLDAPMINQPCQAKESLLLLATSDSASGLGSALASYPDGRYLEIGSSCDTTWRDVNAPERAYAAYLGPMSVGSACREQMTGEHVGDRVTELSADTTDLVLCLCYVGDLDAPTLRPGQFMSDGEIVYLRALQQVLTSMGRRPVEPRTNVYDQETFDQVRQFQQDTGHGHDGVVDRQTWQTVQGRGCESPG